jgi:phosphomannomutase
MIAVTGMNLGEYLKELMDTYGYFFPDRSGIDVDKSMVGKPLVEKLSAIAHRYREGSCITINGRNRTIIKVISVDGLKTVLDDGSWFMIRPSGTEPKVRFYIEARTEDGKKAIFDTAERITKKALG